VQFPDDHPSHGALVHPVQLYDAAFGFLAFAVAMLLYRRRRFRGEIFLGFAFSYGLWRFVTETFRADADRGVWFGGHLSTSQLVSLAVLPVVAFVWWHTLRAVKQGKRKSAREPLEVA
jgi:phosphatidylglycerol:prolipoprotein diacylglycerol transferase